MSKRMPNSVYQSEEYSTALESSGERIVHFGDNFAVERSLSIPLIGEKKILETRGNFDEKSIEAFIEASKEYFYGTIAQNFLDPKVGLFKRLGLKKVDNHTIFIALKKSEEELWKNLEKKSIRWWVKTAEKNGLKFELAKNEEEISQFYNIYQEVADEGGFSPEKEIFVKILADTKISKLFLIKKSNEVIAGGLVLIDEQNDYSILDLTASSHDGLKLQSMPFLYWNLILSSKNLGLSYFDLGGYDTFAKNKDKIHNINQFKERFGGEIKVQPIYSTKLRYPILRAALRRLSFLKAFYKKSE